MNTKLLVPLVILLILPSLVSAADYYVDDCDSGGSGTESNPWCSIQTAINNANPGDTVYIMDGTYYETVEFVRSGSEGMPITFRNYPGHSPVVDATDISASVFDWTDECWQQTQDEGIHYSQCDGFDYITVDGLEVLNGRNYGFAIQGDYNIVTNCKIYGDPEISDEPVLVYSGNYTKITHNVISGSDWNCVNVQNAEFSEIAYNDISNCPEHGGINIFSNTVYYYGPQEGNDVHHNYIHDTSDGGMYFRQQINAKVYNNIVHLGPGSDDNMNIFFHTGNGNSFRSDNVEFFNNIVIGGKWSFDNENGADNLIIKNNIFMNPEGIDPYFMNMYKTTGHVISNNIFFGGGSFGGTDGGDPAFSIDPGFTDWVNGDYTLTENSSAKNAGANLGDPYNDPASPYNLDFAGTPRPQGTDWDIGAYEFIEAQSCFIKEDCTHRECYTAACDNDECVYTADDNLVCDDGLFCTGTETCQSGVCTSANPPCTDGDTYSCTSIQCDEDSKSCGDILYDHSACDDGIACTVDECASDVGCSNAPNDDLCSLPQDCKNATCTLTGCVYDLPGCDAPCPESDLTWQHTPISIQTGTFTAEFDATPLVANIDGLTTLSVAEGSDYDDYAILVRFYNGVIDARDGDVYAADSSISYSADTEYHFRVEVNIPSHTYSVYVTPQGDPNEYTVGTDFAFRTEQQSISELNYWGLRAGTGSHEVCNFQIGSGQPSYHRADTNENGCIEQNELIAFMKRWKISSTDITMTELMEVIGLWKAGTGC